MDWIVKIEGPGRVEGVGCIVGNLLITAGHVFEKEKEQYFWLSGKRYELNESNKVVISYPTHIYNVNRHKDFAIFRIEGITSPISLATSDPIAGETLSCDTLRYVTPNANDIFAQSDNIICTPVEAECKVIQKDGNHLVIDSNPYLQEGDSGAPLIKDNHFYGFLVGGVPDTPSCIFHPVSIISDYLHRIERPSDPFDAALFDQKLKRIPKFCEDDWEEDSIGAFPVNFGGVYSIDNVREDDPSFEEWLQYDLPHIEGGKYGCVNRNGEIVIPCIYDNIVWFQNDFSTLVEKDGKQMIIAKTGEIISDEIDVAFRFSDRYVVRNKNGNGSIFSKDLKQISAEYDSIRLAAIDIRYDLWNVRTDIKHPYRFIVSNNNKFGILSTEGEELVKCSLLNIKNGSQPLFGIENESTIDILDFDGRLLWSTEGEHCSIYGQFTDGQEPLILVQKGEEMCFYSKNGKALTPNFVIINRYIHYSLVKITSQGEIDTKTYNYLIGFPYIIIQYYIFNFRGSDKTKTSHSN